MQCGRPGRHPSPDPGLTGLLRGGRVRRRAGALHPAGGHPGQTTPGPPWRWRCTGTWDRHLSSIQVAITLLTISLGAASERHVHRHGFQRLVRVPALAAGGAAAWASPLGLLAITLLQVVLAELLPRSIAIRAATADGPGHRPAAPVLVPGHRPGSPGQPAGFLTRHAGAGCWDMRPAEDHASEENGPFARGIPAHAGAQPEARGELEDPTGAN